MSDIIKVFEKHIKNLNLNTLEKDLKKHIFRWTYRSKDHIEFMSSNLIGVHTVKYTIDDENDFFGIFDIDKTNLLKDIYSLKDINPDWKVSSNPKYLTIMYLIHKILKSHLSSSLKDKTIESLNLIFSIQVYTSLMVTYFRYPLDKDIAVTVYESLPNRFNLKKEGSWKRLFDYFSQYVKHKGTHEKKLLRFHTKDAMDVAADMQGKIRSTVVEITRVVHNTIDMKQSRESRDMLIENEKGEIELLDVIHSNKVYHNAILDVIYRKNEFINDRYIKMMKEIYSNLYEKELHTTLLYMTENYIDNKKVIDELVETCMNANIKYLYLSKLYPPYDKSVIKIIKFLRGFWINSKVRDPDNVKFKRLGKEFVKKATGKKTERVIVTVVISLSIYLMLIAIDNSRPN